MLKQKTPILKWIQALKFIHEKQEKFGLRLRARVEQSINIKSHLSIEILLTPVSDRASCHLNYCIVWITCISVRGYC